MIAHIEKVRGKRNNSVAKTIFLLIWYLLVGIVAKGVRIIEVAWLGNREILPLIVGIFFLLQRYFYRHANIPWKTHRNIQRVGCIVVREEEEREKERE